MIHRTSIAIFVLLITGPLVADEKPHKPATSATTRPPQSPGKSASIPQAITALSQEFKSNKLREKSDYFGKTPPPDVTPEAVLQALERPIPGGAQLESYVKWQLLSGVPGKFPDDLLKRALALYRRAPYPAGHPGLDRRTLDRTVMGLQKAQMPAANKEFSAIVDRVHQSNAPILSYRAALFERLPVQLDSLQAGMADLHLRVAHGLRSDRFFDTVAAAIRSWAINASRSELNAIGNNVLDLRAAANDKSVKPYTQVYEEKGIQWRTDTPIDPKKLDALVTFLEQSAQSPVGGLKFKDEKK